VSLDIYVMPLWRFKVGDFCSPIETATGMRPTIVTTSGSVNTPAKTGWFSRLKAKRQVGVIRKAVEKANAARIQWNDDGGVVYGEQSQGMEPLRAFAKWLDCREQFPVFVEPPERDYFKHPIWSVEVDGLSCSHLVNHDCFSGYYLPCAFDKLVKVEPYMIFGTWPAARSVGSTPRLLRELDFVQSELRVPDGYDYPEDDLLLAVKTAYLQLREVAAASSLSGLPVIFWG
jgi:hypothetical protein